MRDTRPRLAINATDQNRISLMSITDTAYGPLSMPDWDKDLIVRTLVAHGEWSLCEQLLLAPMIRPQDALWDVGAFLGTFGIGVAQLAVAPPSRLIAVEPNPEVLTYLDANLRRNAPCPHRIAPFAVAQTAGRLHRRGGSGDGNAGAIAYEQAGEQEEFVVSLSLEDLRGEFGAYDVLKLDVEGMEVDAILGDVDYILSRQPVIWAECNETFDSILLLETLCRLKYKPLYVAFPAFRVQNFNQSGDKIFPMAYEAALLAAPVDRMDAFTGKVADEEIILRPVLTPGELRRALWDTPRWSMPEWVDLTKAELVAQLGRQYRGEDFGSFLSATL